MRKSKVMIHAYDKNYLAKFQISFGTMLDFAVHDLKSNLTEFYSHFLNSEICKKIQDGNTSVLAGKSGVELALDIIGDYSKSILYKPVANKSPEYWSGWILAYFQWFTSLKFEHINNIIPIDEILSMYLPYHETDISNITNHLLDLYNQRKKDSNLKIYRQRANLSQRELAELSDVSIRTIQQYEQNQKNINFAKAKTLLDFSKILSCEVADLINLG